MLPSVQTRQMVQSPHYLDPPSSFHIDRRQDQRQDGLSFPHYARTTAHASEPLQGFGYHSTHRTFLPIRSSRPPSLPTHPRPNTFMIPSHVSDHDEHQLRRKTPNGTIDAGYDGNPAQLASGPPPLKHMILSNPSSLVPNAAYSQHDRYGTNHPTKPSDDNYPFQPSRRFNVPADSGADWQRWFNNDSHALIGLDCAPNGPLPGYFPYNNGVQVPTALQPIYQHSPSPALFDNGGLLSPWPGANLSAYHPTAHPGDSSYRYLNHPAAPHPRPSSAYGQIGIGAHLSKLSHYEEGSASLQTPSQGLESLTLEPGQYEGSVSEFDGRPAPGMFKEKALTLAHRSYIELLSYLHQSKKAQSRASQESRSSKMVIFPKLPKPPSQSGCVPTPRQFQTSHPFTGIGGGSNHTTNPEFPDLYRRQFQKHQVRSDNTTNAPFYHLFNSTETPTYPAASQERGRLQATPLSNAKACVETLTILCEQSGWRWIDGMLLGGCLHYGLDHYEDALGWFKRIILLDDRSVAS